MTVKPSKMKPPAAVKTAQDAWRLSVKTQAFLDIIGNISYTGMLFIPAQPQTSPIEIIEQSGAQKNFRELINGSFSRPRGDPVKTSEKGPRPFCLT